jgi:hypothetical protein
MHSEAIIIINKYFEFMALGYFYPICCQAAFFFSDSGTDREICQKCSSSIQTPSLGTPSLMDVYRFGLHGVRVCFLGHPEPG